MKQNYSIALFICLILVSSCSDSTIKSDRNSQTNDNKTVMSEAYSKGLDYAISAGKKISFNKCVGVGATNLSVSPMRADDFSQIVPYGAMIGGHVTPIDHQYFSPTVFSSAPDAYEVRAMADAKLVSIETHPTRIRLVFSVSCTFFYYYDLLTSVEEKFRSKKLPIDVKAGELIGHIGGQTLDFAVWDTTKPLKGFIVPEHYDTEPWKIYTADPLDYYSDEVKSLILSKYVRTAPPVSGKIDHDVDGRVIGNWFEIGSGGYGGASQGRAPGYWTGQLAIAPDVYDPSATIISIGYLAPNEESGSNQFSVPRTSADPATVSVENGLVKYELTHWQWLKADGELWNKMDWTRNVSLENDGYAVAGCALVQLLDKRLLKFEAFMQKRCSEVSEFSTAARVYER